MSAQHDTVLFEAIDTWMFRDGRPFGQDDPGASFASSVFPPYPPTLVGAVRAMLWRRVFKGHWDENGLGDGVDWQDPQTTLGPLSFGPPLVLVNEEPVFPAPLHLVMGKNGAARELTFLRPDPQRKLRTDMGERRMPQPQKALEGIRTLEGCWLTLQGMKAVLDGGLPNGNQLLPAGALWQGETRVGIGIDASSRTVNEGQLYMATHARLRHDVSLAVTVKGCEKEWPQALTPLAGEHRMAATRCGEPLPLPKSSRNLKGKYALIAISPVAPDEDGNVAGLPDPVSACTGKPVPIGGWDSIKKRGLKLRRCWPAGSVWFIDDDTSPPPESIGMATEWGFGRVLAAAWPQ